MQEIERYEETKISNMAKWYTVRMSFQILLLLSARSNFLDRRAKAERKLGLTNTDLKMRVRVWPTTATVMLCGTVETCYPCNGAQGASPLTMRIMCRNKWPKQGDS